MLNQDLLRIIYRNGKFFCRFADTAKEENLALAANFITLFTEGENKSRCELAALSKNVTAGSPDPKLAAGLEKIVFDAACFDAPDPQMDYPALRRELFARSGAALAAPGDFSEVHYRTLYPHPQQDIYGDLPDFEVMRRFKGFTPAELLCRYNVALVQTLLMFAARLTLIISDPENSELRKLVRFMKFFRLLAQIRAPRKNTIELELSGPGALLENARKYGLLLSSFFPAVPLLKKYALCADIEFRGRKGRFELDQNAGLVSHYSNIAAYVPEEIKLFHKLFREKSGAWCIVGDTPFINMGRKGICFPDLSFRNGEGELCHLELFHRWHKGGIADRLAFMEENPEIPLILGIDRGALGDAAFAGLSAAYPRSTGRCFRFREFPGVETVLKTLNKLVKNKEGDPLPQRKRKNECKKRQIT